jgi:uncharacterized protein
LPEPFELEGADGGPLRGDLYPGGPDAAAAVVLCHGFRAYKDWGFIPYLAERIAREGLTAVAFNFSGSGITDREGRFGEPERFRRNTYAWELEDLRRVIDWVRDRPGGPARPPERVGLVGHSRGGAISILTAARDPRVACVAALATPARIMVWPDEYWEAWKRGESAAVYDFRTKARLLLGPDIYEDMTRDGGRYDVPLALDTIATPLLVVQGDRDRQVSMEEAKEIVSRAARTSADLRVIERAGHGFLAGDRLRRTPPQLLEMVEAVTAWMRRVLLA